ncbi:MAG: glycosyltransferase family 1 protein [Candidatus Aenigmarchaeota archaeon]|nr:glycosyltransferase family 4 protein [Candidatus Aenigmarchaeota archaeon]MDW8149571.1 glycosyltransferase family 1 protein [Candidatus Aenigmarchaeota archaeon]
MKTPHYDLWKYNFLTKYPVFSLRTLFLILKSMKNDGAVHFPHEGISAYLNLVHSDKKIVTVHELSSFLFPECREHIFIQGSIRRNLKKADKIIAPSNNTKKDLINVLGIPNEKIHVVYQGINHKIFYPRNTKIFDFPYVLYVGIDHPKKNLKNMLIAFYILKNKSNNKKIQKLKFVKVGEDKRFMDETKKIVKNLNLSKDVVFTGYVSDYELPKYYSSAELLLYCSLYEGFGLPVIEAMACGCPVITSNISSLPEVAGDAGVLVDPKDPEAICREMEKIITDEETREDLMKKGLKRAKEFSWDKTAEETYKVYKTLK